MCRITTISVIITIPNVFLTWNWKKRSFDFLQTVLHYNNKFSQSTSVGAFPCDKPTRTASLRQKIQVFVWLVVQASLVVLQVLSYANTDTRLASWTVTVLKFLGTLRVIPTKPVQSGVFNRDGLLQTHICSPLTQKHGQRVDTYKKKLPRSSRVVP